MLNLPESLDILSDTDLYTSLDDLRRHKAEYGRGRNPDAQYVREFCKGEMRRVQGEIRRRGLPAQRPHANGWVQVQETG